MTGPWEQFQTPEPPLRQAEQEGPWSAYSAPMPAAPKAEPYSGSFLPISRDAQGNVGFDSNAGILGAIKRAVTLPGDVATGQVDPMSDEALKRTVDLAGIASPVNPMLRSGDLALPGVRTSLGRAEIAPPTAQELKAAAGKSYDDARDLGVEYRSSSIRDTARALKTELETDGIFAEHAPKTFSTLGKLTDPPPDSVIPLVGVEGARRAFNTATKDFANPTEQKAGSMARDRLAQFVQGADEKSVVAGPASTASKMYREADANYAAGSRSDRLQGLDYAADLRSSAANSGQNYGNALRSRIASVLTDKKKRAGFNSDEIASLEGIVRGDAKADTARGVGNLLGGGGGLGAGFTGAVGGGFTAAATGDPLMVALGASIPPTIGYATKKVANALSEREFARIDEMTRRRSPLYEQMQADAPLMAGDTASRAAVIRALLLSEQGAD